MQLLQMTMRGRFILALEEEFTENVDFVELVGRQMGTVQAVMAGAGPSSANGKRGAPAAECDDEDGLAPKRRSRRRES